MASAAAWSMLAFMMPLISVSSTRTSTIRVYITMVDPVRNRLASGYAAASRVAMPCWVGRFIRRRSGRSTACWFSLTRTTAEKAARVPRMT
ncbi:hypothetical protein ACFQ1I_03520 [Kitasatospora arboriphila]